MCNNCINAQKVDVTRLTDEKKLAIVRVSRDFLRKRRLKAVRYMLLYITFLGRTQYM